MKVYLTRLVALATAASACLLGAQSTVAAEPANAADVAVTYQSALDPPVATASASRTLSAADSAPSSYENPSPYYEVSQNGTVWPLGGATDFGSVTASHLNGSIIGVTLTPDAGGYWLVGSDGGIFSFGDAQFYGSTGNLKLNRPIIGMTSTPDGHGYWLYAGDGGIFSFGDAHFYGSTGNLKLNEPIVSLSPTADNAGYWMIGSDGGIFSFGDAAFYGSLGGSNIGQSVDRIVTSSDGGGYWEVTHDGDVHPFGSALNDAPPILAFVHTVESAGDAAMEWAMSKLGVPYLWGGTGAGGFDCSGLVMEAWLAAGVAIPRVAASQYAAGSKVGMNQLVAGDLVYWASNPADPTTIEHVAMYIGGGHMVNAPYTGQVVRTDWIGGTGFVTLGTHP